MLLKRVSNSFMSHSASIGFLSVYPGDKEVLYPPVTYLRPIKTFREVNGSQLMIVVTRSRAVLPALKLARHDAAAGRPWNKAARIAPV